MSTANNPAFPNFDPKAPASDCEWTQGITKREYFAAMAMQGLLSAGPTTGELYATIARDAVAASDALLESLAKQT